MEKRAAKLLTGIVSVLVCQAGLAIELDRSFGDQGRVLTQIGRDGDLRGLATYPDGRIVVVGNHDQRILVAFYLADGRPDSAKGDGGLLPITHGQCGSVSIALQADGKIVIGGFTNGPMESGWMIVRLLPDGALDPSFGGDGFSLAAAGIAGIAIQSDGRIVAG